MAAAGVDAGAKILGVAWIGPVPDPTGPTSSIESATAPRNTVDTSFQLVPGAAPRKTSARRSVRSYTSPQGIRRGDHWSRHESSRGLAASGEVSQLIVTGGYVPPSPARRWHQRSDCAWTRCRATDCAIVHAQVRHDRPVSTTLILTVIVGGACSGGSSVGMAPTSASSAARWLGASHRAVSRPRYAHLRRGSR